MIPALRFCGACGGSLEERLLAGEQRPRLVCAACGAVAWRNPKVLVSTVVAAAGRVLLCRRAEPPAAGWWALPGGFMECDESLEEAAARETLEETGVRLAAQDLRLHAVSTLPYISEVYVGFRVELPQEPVLVCGPECAEVRFFGEDELPWAELAYPEIENYLRMYFSERGADAWSIHLSRLDPAGVVGNTYRIAGVDEVRIVRPPDWGRRNKS
jgi:ADP-ribose pyrophosphatase YjhB (NUDIX family)